MIKAETELEKRILSDEDLRNGLEWGEPRSGHPEGKVILHVQQILGMIDAQEIKGDKREKLRLLAIIHDSFKERVNRKELSMGGKNHGSLAREFAQKYINDEDLLNMLELHDKPYSIWRTYKREGKFREVAFVHMIDRIKDIQLFLDFVKLDGGVKGKSSEPRDWFEDKLREYNKV